MSSLPLRPTRPPLIYTKRRSPRTFGRNAVSVRTALRMLTGLPIWIADASVGFAVTGGSAQLLMRMDPAARAAILHELYADDGNNIGTSYIRVSIGSSDMNDHVYSYDDIPEGQTDPDMTHFSLAPDETDVIPVLKEILAINPKIKILA